jgi:hypothetical protein
VALSRTVKSYFRAQAAAVEARGFWNCLTAAETLATLLLAEGWSPWIGRLRKSETRGDTVFHAPLIPLRSRGGRAWTTHYVCVEGEIAYDPAGLRPFLLRRYTQSVFGEELPIETFVAQADVARYLESRRFAVVSSPDAANVALLARIIEFIRSLGIEVADGEMHRATLVPGIDIRHGRLVVEPKRMCKPADLLHEAAHVALRPIAERAALDGTLDGSAAEEMAAIAWTWAAAMHLRIPPGEVFHEEVISGNGPTLLENFSEGRYVGVPMLQYWGMTRERSGPADGVEPYPHMIRWTRDT